MKRIILTVAALLITLAAFASEPLMIADQGIFSSGGVTITSPGGAPEPGSDDYNAVLEDGIAVVMYFGDYIDNGDPAIAATGAWQAMRSACYSFRDAFNAAGGNCTVVDLPQLGIYGNDHFMFQDLNSDEIAALVENWITDNV